MKRIRYEKSKYLENTLESVRNIHSKSTGNMFIVYIDLTENTYRIKNITTNRSHSGGDGINNLDVLKRKVKIKLESLGVQFATEVRKLTEKKGK